MTTILQQNTTPRRGTTFLTLFGAGLIGIITLAGMLIYLMPTLVTDQELPPAPLLFVVVMIQYGVLLALAVWGGLSLTKRMNFNPLPILTGSARDRRLLWGAISGLLAGVAMLVTYWLVFLPLTGIPLNTAQSVPTWLGLSNAFLYGGITEELLMRLGLMTVLLWIGSKVSRDANNQPTTMVFWVVNIIVTVLFGLGHLPAVALTADITPMVVVQALVLNSVAMLFGWLYWRRGLETAIIAHMTVHIGYTTLGILLG